MPRKRSTAATYRRKAKRVVKRRFVRKKRFGTVSKPIGQLFPRRMFSKCRMRCNYVPTSAGQPFTFKGNSFYLAGPQTNNSGTFSANVPSGLLYLLSQNTNAGSSAPYNQYRIHSSRINLQYITNEANTKAVKLTCFPSISSISTGLTQLIAIEQPNTKFRLCPSDTNTKSIVLVNYMETRRMYGINKGDLTAPQFMGTAVADPAYTWYWQCDLNTIDGAGTIDALVQVTIDYWVEFVSIQTFSSAVPA